MHMPILALPLIGMPGPWEWIVIIGIVLLLFGATKLPQLGKGLGEGIRNFKKGLKGDEKQTDIAAADDEKKSKAGEKTED